MQPSSEQPVSLRDSLVGRVLRGTGNVAYHIKDCIGKRSYDDPLIIFWRIAQIIKIEPSLS